MSDHYFLLHAFANVMFEYYTKFGKAILQQYNPDVMMCFMHTKIKVLSGHILQ